MNCKGFLEVILTVIFLNRLFESLSFGQLCTVAMPKAKVKRSAISPAAKRSGAAPQAAHVCLQCSSSFPVKDRLARHVRAVHEQRRDHKCKQCGSRFADMSHLNRHVRSVHEGQREHKCPLCDSRFQNACHLRRHVRTLHEGQRNHKCPHCDRRFQEASHLRRHMRVLHGDSSVVPDAPPPPTPTPAPAALPPLPRFFCCIECARTFGGRAELLQHVRSAHEKRRRHHCCYGVCSKTFGSWELLCRHAHAEHNVIFDDTDSPEK